MRSVIVLALPCFFGLVGLSVPGGPSTEERLARAQERFRLGVERLGQPAESRRFFGQAADELERLSGSVPSPAFYLSLGNAEALAGRWPRAIWAYQCGLEVDPNSAALREHLGYARSLVNYPPGNRGRPVADAWPRWLHRLTAADLLILATSTYGLAWLAGGWWYVRRRAVPLAAALCLFAVALAAGAGYLLEERQAHRTRRDPHLVVVAADTPLHRGNGPSYPLHPDVPTLPAGLEAWSLHRRGAWVQVRLSTGEIGWVRGDAVLIVASR
jgi:hypothetical protein